jgi:hypothetical protein
MVFPSISLCDSGKKKPPGLLAVLWNPGMRLPDLLRQRPGKAVKVKPELAVCKFHDELSCTPLYAADLSL